jgi:hypothetical protein
MLMIGGAIALYFSGMQLARNTQSSHWPWADAKVLSINYEEFYSASDSGDKVAEVHLSYQYTLGGQVYKSDQVSIGTTKYKRGVEELLFLKKYRAGDYIKVHYNPAHPEQAVIITGADFMDYARTISTAFVCYFGFRIMKFEGFRKLVNSKVIASV